MNADELSGNLKLAVDAVRGQQAPAEAMARSLDRARRLHAIRNPQWQRRLALIGSAVVAASLLVWVSANLEPPQSTSRGEIASSEIAQASPNLATTTTETKTKKKAVKYHEFAGKEGTDCCTPCTDTILAVRDQRRSPPDLRLPDGVDPDEPIGLPSAAEGKNRSVPPADIDKYKRSVGGESDNSPSGRQLEEIKRLESKQEIARTNSELGRRDRESLERQEGERITDATRPSGPQDDSYGGNGSGPGMKGFGPPVLSKIPYLDRYFRNLGRDQGANETDKKPTAPPKVWKRTGPPTFARVYVGDGNSLELVSLHVTVTIEGSRARTVVDHVFRNPHSRQLEGTFEYPLPTGASPSYFAMFLGQTRDTMPPLFAGRGDAPPLPQDALARLTPDQLVDHVSNKDWGRLQQARVVSKEKALETYEEVTRQRIDPALLEYAAGNTFRGRVFPIPANGFNRVLLAYEEQLPFVGDQVRYAFPLPDGKMKECQLTLSASAAECKDAIFSPKEAKREEGGSRLAFAHTWRDEIKGGSAVFAFTPPQPQVQAISGRQGESGPLYLHARIRPDLKVEKSWPFAHHAIFLLDTSLSEHPDRFDMNMKLMRGILEADTDIDQFNVLTFNVGTAWVQEKGWIDNTAAGRDMVFKRLDGLVLEGATDFGAALDQLANGKVQPPGGKGGGAAEVFVLSDGQITWGETDASTLVAGFEQRCGYRTRFHCFRTGLGAENLELYGALTRKGGGIYNCFTKDDVTTAAKAHRRQCLRVESVKIVGGKGAADVLIAGRQAAVYPGGDLVVAARMNGIGKAQIVVEGTFNGEKFAQEYPIEVRGDGELAPRGWGEIAVSSLLALNDPKLDGLATAYCQQFNIGSRAASFLILENENDYKRFNLEEERGKTLSGDLAKFLDEAWTALGKPMSARNQFSRFLKQVDGRTKVLSGDNGKHVNKLLTLLKEADFDLPAAPIAGALLRKRDVPPEYLAARDADRRNVSAYLNEAKRRAAADEADSAVRVLSSVIEEHPGRGDALRLVGYRLLDLKQAVQAARLFQQVQRQRPFEPHSYRDLARSLEEAGKYGLAAVQYEIILAGTWHSRFHESLKTVAREEYAAMMREAIRKKAVGKELADLFGERLEGMAADTRTSDLRVTISWNTDNTDVDLWVMEPDGSKCFYQNRKTQSGGELSEDMTQGYGPERYRVANAVKGTYRVMVHYYAANPNLLAGETHVNVVVTRFAGTPKETTERHTVILKTSGEAVEVCRVEN